MTVHDDLATLRQYRTGDTQFDAALSRVEAENARLREERDALIRDRERWRLEWQAEVKAAEAARDEAIRLRGVATEWAAELAGKKHAAEAEAARLRDGLRQRERAVREGGEA